MIIYNVTVKVERAIHEDWLKWVRETHIPEVMATNLFESHKFCRILHEEPDGVTYAIQYFCKDMATLQQYQAKHAPALQADHQQRYPNKYIAFRTLMEVL